MCCHHALIWGCLMLHDVHRLSRYEKIIIADRSLPREITSILGGASRATRLSRKDEMPRERIATEVATGVLAPLVFLYASWILVQARQLGVRRLYFLARDGYIIMKVAEVLAHNWGMDIELRYLHTSREAWLFPSLQEIDNFTLSWITWGYLSSISVDEIEKRLRFPAGALWRQLASMPEFSGSESTSSLSTVQIDLVKTTLTREDILCDLCLRADTALENVRGYLAGQGLFESKPYALVDTGWKATSQYGLSLILGKLKSRTHSGVTAFYLGLNKGHHLFDGDSALSFLFDWNRSGIDYRLYNFLCLELLLSARDGRTIGYSDASDGYAPILLDNPCPENLWAVDIHHECVLSYVGYASRFISLNDLSDGGARLCRKLVATFISRPTSEEATVYGDLMIAGEMGERDLQPLGPQMNYREFAMIALRKRKIRGFWPQGSLVRSGMRLAHLLYCLVLDIKLLDWYRRVILKY